jgi:hypothetical protein
MQRMLLGVASCALGLALTGGPLQAHPHGHGSGGVVVSGAYYQTHGHRFSGGYYYRGRHHTHWSGRVWSSTCNRWHYYDPYLNCYYYWHASSGCWYPVGYLP